MSLLLREKASRGYLCLLAIISGILLWLSWPPFEWNFVIFIALIPILLLEDQLSYSSKAPNGKIVIFSYVAFVLWNAITTYWIWYASPPGALLAIVLNSLLMCLPILFYHRVKAYTQNRFIGYISLICFWLMLEMLHFNWEAPWPWLTLGNVWASSTNWIQWYEYTGVLGGTIWVWTVNILVYEFIRSLLARTNVDEAAGTPQMPSRKREIMTGTTALLAIAIPIIISYCIKPAPMAAGKLDAVVVQPNFDPWNEKFDENSFDRQVNTLLQMSGEGTDTNSTVVIWPETSLPSDIDERQVLYGKYISRLMDFSRRHHDLNMIIGATTYYVYTPGEKPSLTARNQNGAFFDLYNTALELDSTDHFGLYHKSKLVPGVEKMPYPKIFGFLEGALIKLGGSSGSYGSQDTPTIFHLHNGINAAPVICYESIFGEHVSRFIQKGANIITIITNDGWWKDTPGLRQHFRYATLRAIENRRMVARSGNTGISCFIAPSGDIITTAKAWVPAVLKQNLQINNTLTFYTKHGDYLGRIGIILGFGLLFIAFFGGLIPKYLYWMRTNSGK